MHTTIGICEERYRLRKRNEHAIVGICTNFFLNTQQTTLKLLTSSLTPWFMKPMKVKNSDKISVHISGDVMIRYNWNLKIVNIGMLANKYAGLNKKPAKKDNTVTLRTYLVTNGVSRQ